MPAANTGPDMSGRGRTRGVRSPGPVIKVCGLTRKRDVLLAADLGAWAVGFIFARSPRRVSPGRARELARALRAAHTRGTGPLVVGVFADQPPEEVARVVSEVGLDAVQLHGEESPYQVGRICSAAGAALVIKVISVEHGTAAAAGITARVRAVASTVDAVLLDSKVRDRIGGTGVSFKWELARPVAGLLPVLVAGGIGPGNAATALATSGAWGIDVNSGVEAAPGIKDEGLLRGLFAAVNQYRREKGIS